MDKQSSRRHLIRILQSAYSGELAAALAYRGHWKSLEDHAETNKIRQIEEEEWIHRQKVGRMLDDLASGPLKIKEIKMWLIGRTVGLACHFTGWFLPMYFAGRLETVNVEEYEIAASCASDLGLSEFEG